MSSASTYDRVARQAATGPARVPAPAARRVRRRVRDAGRVGQGDRSRRRWSRRTERRTDSGTAWHASGVIGPHRGRDAADRLARYEARTDGPLLALSIAFIAVYALEVAATELPAGLRSLITAASASPSAHCTVTTSRRRNTPEA